MKKLVIYPAIDHERWQRLKCFGDELQMVNANDEATAIEEIAEAQAFFGKITPGLLRAAHRLEWVQSPTASLEHYLFPELIEHPCLLSNMRGLFSDVIADHVMGYVLCFARNLHIYLRQQATGTWAPVGDQSMVVDFVSAPGRVSPVDLAHQHLSDLTLGVVGVGQIGAEICRRARAFGMRVLGVDPVCREISELDMSVQPMSQLTSLLAEAHYVVIATPHTPETEKLFDRSLLQQMRRDAVLINIGRGAIVVLDDLVAALQAEELRGAALDVCEQEPLPSDHPLWRMPNVIITPHVAAASPRIAERHLETLLENIRCFLRGQPLKTLVDKRKWY